MSNPSDELSRAVGRSLREHWGLFLAEGIVLVVLGVLALMLPGCAHNAGWLQRQPAVESTIGNDPKKMPAGKVIPPPGLGVDLSDRSTRPLGTARA